MAKQGQMVFIKLLLESWLFLLQKRFTERDNLMTESETCLKICEKRPRIEKCLVPLRELWFVNQRLTISVQGEVVLKWFKASKRSAITVNISFSAGLIQHYLSEGNIRN